eukprot:683044_1
MSKQKTPPVENTLSSETINSNVVAPIDISSENLQLPSMSKQKILPFGNSPSPQMTAQPNSISRASNPNVVAPASLKLSNMLKQTTSPANNSPSPQMTAQPNSISRASNPNVVAPASLKLSNMLKQTTSPANKSQSTQALNQSMTNVANAKNSNVVTPTVISSENPKLSSISIKQKTSPVKTSQSVNKSPIASNGSKVKKKKKKKKRRKRRRSENKPHSDILLAPDSAQPQIQKVNKSQSTKPLNQSITNVSNAKNSNMVPPKSISSENPKLSNIPKQNPSPVKTSQSTKTLNQSDIASSGSKVQKKTKQRKMIESQHTSQPNILLASDSAQPQSQKVKKLQSTKTLNQSITNVSNAKNSKLSRMAKHKSYHVVKSLSAKSRTQSHVSSTGSKVKKKEKRRKRKLFQGKPHPDVILASDSAQPQSQKAKKSQSAKTLNRSITNVSNAKNASVVPPKTISPENPKLSRISIKQKTSPVKTSQSVNKSPIASNGSKVKKKKKKKKRRKRRRSEN